MNAAQRTQQSLSPRSIDSERQQSLSPRSTVHAAVTQSTQHSLRPALGSWHSAWLRPHQAPSACSQAQRHGASAPELAARHAPPDLACALAALASEQVLAAPVPLPGHQPISSVFEFEPATSHIVMRQPHYSIPTSNCRLFVRASASSASVASNLRSIFSHLH